MKYGVMFKGLLMGSKEEVRTSIGTDDLTIAKAIFRHYRKKALYIMESGVVEIDTRKVILF